MHKNRLIELTQISGKSERIGSRLVLPPSIQAMREEQTQLEQWIDKMVNNNEELGELRNELKKTANPAKQKDIHARFNKASKENRGLLTKIQTGIRQMNEKQKKEFEAGNKADTLRVARVTQKASKAIQDFKQNQQKFSNGVKDNIRRQATILQGNISEKEVNDIMENPERGQEMLKAKLLDSPSIELESAVSDIIDKYNSIKELQKCMQQCLAMTQELALLVALTGEQLDNIENTINLAEDFTVKGEQKLVDAKEQHKSGNKKMCCIIMLLLAIVGAVVIPILITKL